MDEPRNATTPPGPPFPLIRFTVESPSPASPSTTLEPNRDSNVRVITDRVAAGDASGGLKDRHPKAAVPGNLIHRCGHERSKRYPDPARAVLVDSIAGRGRAVGDADACAACVEYSDAVTRVIGDRAIDKRRISTVDDDAVARVRVDSAAVDGAARAVCVGDAAAAGGLNGAVAYCQIRCADAGDSVASAADRKRLDDDAIACDYDRINVRIRTVDSAADRPIALQSDVVSAYGHGFAASASNDDAPGPCGERLRDRST